MKKSLLLPLLLAFLTACTDNRNQLPVRAWTGGPGQLEDAEILRRFRAYREKGIDGLMYNGGQDPAVYARIGRLAHRAGLELHAWIPTLVQAPVSGIDSSWYGVNGRGESAYDKPPFVEYYRFLCPGREEVYHYLRRMYQAVAAVPEVDGIHLDYIRFPDVILAPGLWNKYGLVMDREYPDYDYCYCGHCVAGYQALSGIDIRSVDDPSQVPAWKQYRYNLVTKLVNRLAADVHAAGKPISAAVFPGPGSIAREIVRQEWDRWELDAFYPMHYNDFYLKGPEWVGEVTREGVTALAGKAPLYSGLFICPDPEGKATAADPENHGLLPSELSPAIAASLENGAAGICLFTPERMTPAHWDALEKILRHTKAGRKAGQVR